MLPAYARCFGLTFGIGVLENAIVRYDELGTLLERSPETIRKDLNLNLFPFSN